MFCSENMVLNVVFLWWMCYSTTLNPCKTRQDKTKDLLFEEHGANCCFLWINMLFREHGVYCCFLWIHVMLYSIALIVIFSECMWCCTAWRLLLFSLNKCAVQRVLHFMFSLDKCDVREHGAYCFLRINVLFGKHSAYWCWFSFRINVLVREHGAYYCFFSE